MLVIDFFGAFLASPAGRNRNHSVPESDASASFWARPASARRIVGRAVRGGCAHDEDVRGQQAENGAPARSGPVVDVHAVAAGDEADEAAGTG